MLKTEERAQADHSGVNQCLSHSKGYTACVGMDAMDPCFDSAFESHAFSARGAEKDPRWLYVGEKGSQTSERQRLVDDKEEQSPLGDCHCDRRERCLCCLLFFLVLVCSGLLAAYLALSSSNAPSMPWRGAGRAPFLPWLPWGSSPSTSGAPARSAVDPSAVVDSMSAEPYDCADQYYERESMWTENKTAWCCKHEHKGCTKITTSAAPPATSLSSKADVVREKRQPTSDACSASCTFDAQTATCGQRVQFAAEYVFFAEVDPCRDAHDLVLKECGSCSSCMLDATGCKSATKSM